MKKHGLLKVLGILLLIVVILSYILVGRYGERSYIGLGDTLLNSLQSLYYFFDTALFILVVGGFYGVLSKTSAYKKLLDKIVTSVKPHSKRFLYVVIIAFAIIASLTGMTLPLIIFVPLFISIILLLGYDKLVALTATVGSIMIGFVGGIFVSFRDPSNYYGVSYTTFDKLVGLSSNYSNIFPRLLLLLAGIALLIIYLNKYIKNVEAKKVKYELNDNTDLLVTEVKGNYKDIKTWPLIVILSVMFVLLVLGLVPWNSLFNITVFDKFHTWLTGLSIKKFAIFPSIISSNFPAFGNWTSLGNYMMVMILLLVFTFIIKLVSRMKYDEMVDAFVEGMKKMLPTAALIIVAYGVLVCSYNNGFMENLITKSEKFNYGISSLIAILGSVLNVDLYYTAAGIFTPLVGLITDEGVYNSVSVLLQGLFGVVSFAGPTSIILIFGLSYLDIPYTTWLKYIWRFVLYLLVLVALVVLILALL